MAKFIRVLRKANDESMTLQEVAGRLNRIFPDITLPRVKRLQKELKEKAKGELTMADIYKQWAALAKKTIGHVGVTPELVAENESYYYGVHKMIKDLTRQYDLDQELFIDGFADALTFDEVRSEDMKLEDGSMKALDVNWNDLDEVWDWLVDNSYFTNEELQLLTSINGTSFDTIDDAVYARYGYDDVAQFAEEEGEDVYGDNDEEPVLPDEVLIDLDLLVDFPERYDGEDLVEAIDTYLKDEYQDTEGADAFNYDVEGDQVRVYNINWVY